MYYILMADIIDSSGYQSSSLMTVFRKLVNKVNEEQSVHIKSKLTITLGDEFQGVVNSLQSSLQVIFRLEELVVARALDFQLRYVLLHGEIDTPISSKRAHGMLGKGLTDARQRLEEMKTSSSRFYFEGFEGSGRLNQLFVLYQHFVDSWNKKDWPVVEAFLRYEDYKKVAKKLNRDPSTMWRREKSLAIEEYRTCKDLINSVAA